MQIKLSTIVVQKFNLNFANKTNEDKQGSGAQEAGNSWSQLQCGNQKW